MKRILIIVLSVLGGLLALALLAAVIISVRARTSPQTVATTTNPFGFATSTLPATNTDGSLQLLLSDGTYASFPDITKQDQPAWAGPTSGYLAGGGSDDAFQIVYFPADHAGGRAEFTVSLNQIPLKAIRLEAENTLKTQYHFTNAQMCGLGVEVYVAPGVDDSYLGQNLGLSFCAGSVTLP